MSDIILTPYYVQRSDRRHPVVTCQTRDEALSIADELTHRTRHLHVVSTWADKVREVFAR